MIRPVFREFNEAGGKEFYDFFQKINQFSLDISVKNSFPNALLVALVV